MLHLQVGHVRMSHSWIGNFVGLGCRSQRTTEGDRTPFWLKCCELDNGSPPFFSRASRMWDGARRGGRRPDCGPVETLEVLSISSFWITESRRGGPLPVPAVLLCARYGAEDVPLGAGPQGDRRAEVLPHELPQDDRQREAV